MRNKCPLLFVLFSGASLSVAIPQQKVIPLQSDRIRINQIGYYPEQEKIAAVVEGVPSGDYLIRNVVSGEVAFKGNLSAPRSSDISPEKTRIADFSQFNIPGQYVMEVPGTGISYSFAIKEHIYSDPALWAMKSYYFQRSGTELPVEFVGAYARPAAILDDQVMIHPSAASSRRPAGSLINSSGGWYDAGDYGKYIVNSAFTVGMLLGFYEDHPEDASAMNLNIPESSNNTPDFLDEVMYNINWMLTMQDPDDGGVYHKLTSIVHDPFVSPEQQSTQRYVIYKGVTSSLGFAASLSQASRLMTPYQKDYPGMSAKMLQAAQRAYDWAKKNPDTLYDQDAENKKYNQEMNTGAYGDGNAKDEFFWAATELYLATGESRYLKDLQDFMPDVFRLPVWNQVSGLGTLALIRHREQISDHTLQKIETQLQNQLLQYADRLLENVDQSPYKAPYGRVKSDFFWACNSDACENQGIALLTAYRLTGNKKYLTNALRNADYVFGRNATGYCYLTGFGTKSPRFPHHRLFATDGVDAPYPGFMIGGPNPGQQDGVTYYSNIPDQSYVDFEPAYACNEIAINWQAVTVYFLGALDATLKEDALK